MNLQVLAEELKCDVSEVADFELSVYDTQPGCVGGARDDFVFSGRLDNLAPTFCALWALLDTCSDASSLMEESCIRMVALFDNAEVQFLLILDYILLIKLLVSATKEVQNVKCEKCMVTGKWGRFSTRGTRSTDNAAGHDTHCKVAGSWFR